jgi:hypothetical protein
MYCAQSAVATNHMKHVYVFLATLVITSCANKPQLPPADEVDTSRVKSIVTPPPPASDIRQSPAFVSREQMGDAWPFEKIDAGMLACFDGVYCVLQADDGEVYALNGAAETAGWKSIDSIWRDNPSMAGLKVSVADVLGRARVLCR